MIVVADTSGIIAASDRRATESGACRDLLGSAGTVILALDRRDFRAIRPLTPHNAFCVLPDDL